MMRRSIAHFITKILMACIVLQALTPTLAFALGNVSFDVQHVSNGSLRFTLQENNIPLIHNIDLLSLSTEKHFGSTSIERDGDRFFVHYNSDKTKARMGIIIQANGDIELKSSMDTCAVHMSNNDVELYESANTLSESGLTWNFKTSGKLTNTGNLLFYIINTHAREFHNYGIIKALTGTLRQTYQYNVGCFDFGDLKASGEWWNSYNETFQKIKERNTSQNITPSPQFADNTIDDYGIFLAKHGHNIEGLTYQNKGIYINDGHLELKKANFNNNGVFCFVAGKVTGHQHSWINNEPSIVGTFEGAIPKMDIANLLYLMQDTTLEVATWSSKDWLICLGNLSITITSKCQPKVGCFIGLDVVFEIQEKIGQQPQVGLITKSGIARHRTITDHFLNTCTITRNKYSGIVSEHETGYLFEKREYREKIIDVSKDISSFERFMGYYKNRKDPIDAIKENIRKNLYKLAAAKAHKDDLLYGLMQALASAGIPGDVIEDILTDPEIESLLDSIANWDNTNDEEKRQLTDPGSDAGFSLKHMASLAYTKGLNLTNWALKNPGDFMDILCTAAAAGRSVAPQHPVVKGINTLCGLRMAHSYASSGRFSAGARGCLIENKQRLTHFFKDLQSINKGLPKKTTPLSDGVARTPEKVRVEKPHGNSKEYVGHTHVYVIRDSKTQTIHKVGESMRGVNRYGQSRRAEDQVRTLRKEGKDMSTEIRQIFDSKAAARSYETRLIQKIRGMNGSNTLPGNKGVH